MSNITTIFIDFGRVLVDYDFLQFFQVLQHDYPINKDAFKEFMQVVLAEETYSSLDREVTPFNTQIAELKRQHPACAQLFDAFNERFQEVVTGEVPGMDNLLTQLRNNGYRLYGLSNWSSKVHETMRNYQIFRHLQGRILSCEEHLLKPERTIYERALERFGVAAEECVFIDDKQPNIEGCRAVGIDGILFTDAANLAAELKKRGVRL
ncbi:MAG: HAD family hydrolase [Muribaculaceae bacterium]